MDAVDASGEATGAENRSGFLPIDAELERRPLFGADDSDAGRFWSMSMRLRQRFAQSVRNIENFRLVDPSTAAEIVCIDHLLDDDFSAEVTINSRLLFEASAGPVRLLNASHPTAHHAALSFAREVHRRVRWAQTKFCSGRISRNELYRSESDLHLLSDPACWEFVRDMVLVKFGAAAAEIDLTVIPAIMTLECAFVLAALRDAVKPKSLDWPPDFDWHFIPGQFAFRKKSGELNGLPWATLQLLATRKRAVSSSEIKEVVWQDDFVDDASVRKAVGAARKALRSAFALPDDIDPIPNKDKGERCAWIIDEDVLREKRNS